MVHYHHIQQVNIMQWKILLIVQDDHHHHINNNQESNDENNFDENEQQEHDNEPIGVLDFSLKLMKQINIH